MTPHNPTPTHAIGVSVRQASSLTSVSEKIIRDEVNAGNIPARRVGTRIVIDHQGLTDWFRSHPFVVEPSA